MNFLRLMGLLPLLTVMLAAPMVHMAHGAVTGDEAAQLGQSLTAFGASKEGNKDGSIPAYGGGLPANTNPPGFKKGSGFWVDPFAEDKPLFSITGKNADKYADKLVEGDLELLKRHPNFRMDVYPTRRSVAYPESYLVNTLKNATRCATIHEGQALKGCYGGRPFPLVKNAYEAMWNLQLHYMGPTTRLKVSAWYVDASGRKLNTALLDTIADYPYYYPDISAEILESKYDGVFGRGLNALEGPARVVGEAIFSRYFMNPVDNADEYWIYQPGLRRARNAPENAYDFPVASIGGAAFYDERIVFSGRMDRFEFKLLGKVEKYIPYNTYKLENATPEQALQDQYVNPDLVRWELHRVWVVEATLRAGYRHVYAKRRFYLDEDEPGAAVTVAWNRQGQIQRMVHAGLTPHYDVQIPYAFVFWSYDFISGVYSINLLPGGRKGVTHEPLPRRNTIFSPENLSRISVR